MKSWLLALLVIPFVVNGQDITKALRKNIPGQFSVEERGDGAFVADYKRGDLNVQMTFLGKPQVGQDRITYIYRPPLVQMSFMVLPKEEVRSELQAKVILNSVKTEYEKINLPIKEIKEVDKKNETIGGKRGDSFQYIIDLENGIREFLTVKVVSNGDFDVIPFTRVILSPTEAQDVEMRVKGNSTAANFFQTLQIR